MQYELTLNSKITLNNGVKIPVLGLGTFLSEGKNVEKAISWALEAGYRHIDTAAFYDNEISVGKAVKNSNIPRDELFITTKLWNNSHGYNKALKAFEASLKRLNLEYIDLYLIHWPVPGKRVETWKALEKIYKEGEVKAIGVSNFSPFHLKEIIKESDVIPAVNQVEFTPFLYQKELLDFCKDNGIQLEAYSPLTRGTKLGNPKLAEIAAKYKKSSAQLLIRWGLQHGLVSIPKSSHKERIIENSQVFDFEISEDDMNKLNGIDEVFRITPWDPSSEDWK